MGLKIGLVAYCGIEIEICPLFVDEASSEIYDLVLLVITIIFMEIVTNILPILPTLSKYAQGYLRASCLSHMCMQMAHDTIMCDALWTRVWISLDMPCPTHVISQAFSCPSHRISPFFALTREARRSVELKN